MSPLINHTCHRKYGAHLVHHQDHDLAVCTAMTVVQRAVGVKERERLTQVVEAQLLYAACFHISWHLGLTRLDCCISYILDSNIWYIVSTTLRNNQICTLQHSNNRRSSWISTAKPFDQSCSHGATVRISVAILLMNCMCSILSNTIIIATERNIQIIRCDNMWSDQVSCPIQSSQTIRFQLCMCRLYLRTIIF